jgi:hypothetical protein
MLASSKIGERSFLPKYVIAVGQNDPPTVLKIWLAAAIGCIYNKYGLVLGPC